MKPVYDALGPEGFGTYEVSWTENGPGFRRVSRPPQGLIVPGFVDVHIHGAFGIDFMSATLMEMRELAGKLAEVGYEAFLPTTITAPANEVLRAIDHLPAHEMIPGFHLEGPFISPEFPGAQPIEAIASPASPESAWDLILDDPRMRLITLAPEVVGGLQLITRLRRPGLTVSMGHTNATYDEARMGFEFGASHVTHTFNAMRPFHHREAGILGYLLKNESLTTELIYDRHHVAFEAASVLVGCRPTDRMIAVSDSTAATGLKEGKEFTMWGHEVVLGEKCVRMKSNGALAGSAVTLLDCFRNLVEDFDVETAIRCCCVNPRQLLGNKTPKIYLEFDREFNLVSRFTALGEQL
ncbi:MAG: amidohydrolase family protein [Fimbriimonadaceae bacterium]|nr:amidohydrolase family protein [Fimbriimonadaceae bacterium]